MRRTVARSCRLRVDHLGMDMKDYAVSGEARQPEVRRDGRTSGIGGAAGPVLKVRKLVGSCGLARAEVDSSAHVPSRTLARPPLEGCGA